MSDWSRVARETIGEAHKAVPADATFKERKAIIDAAYPFGPRSMWPYKAWLTARRNYLKPFDPKTPLPLSAFAGWDRDPETGRPLI